MTFPIREQVIQRVMDVMHGLPSGGGAGVSVTRNAVSIIEQALPAVNVLEGSLSAAVDDSTFTSIITQTVIIEAAVSGAEEDIGPLASDLHRSIVESILGPDGLVSGVIIDVVDDGADFEAPEQNGGAAIIVFVVRFLVRYMTDLAKR